MFRRLRRSRHDVRVADRPVQLRWFDIPADRTAEHPGLIPRLVAKEFDGMTITGVFSEDELRRTVPALDAMRGVATPQVFGSMLGMPLNMIGDESQDLTPFLDDTDRCQPLYREAFGFDPAERLRSVLSPMAGDLRLDPPTEQGRPYNFANVRWYDPGSGGLKAHAGNEFIQIAAKGAMSHLLAQTRVWDHISWFVVLQPPEAGGQLSVYDLLWADYHDHETAWSDATRDDSFFDTVACMQPNLGAGDMVMFGGGWRWHRVDQVRGTIPRMTYGGFASPALAGEVLNVWC
jgi:hypothetical protein